MAAQAKAHCRTPKRRNGEKAREFWITHWPPKEKIVQSTTSSAANSAASSAARSAARSAASSAASEQPLRRPISRLPQQPLQRPAQQPQQPPLHSDSKSPCPFGPLSLFQHIGIDDRQYARGHAGATGALTERFALCSSGLSRSARSRLNVRGFSSEPSATTAESNMCRNLPLLSIPVDLANAAIEYSFTLRMETMSNGPKKTTIEISLASSHSGESTRAKRSSARIARTNRTHPYPTTYDIPFVK
mmetsp:Transcript_10146/g.22019  ORF Transcript_10146/g.22019 Transcript_10146/m.22019 type:complete len:246 (+) Transcript_10146:54-791(+)